MAVVVNRRFGVEEAVGPTKTRPMGRPKVEWPDRRDLIIDAAYGAFVALGFSGCTTEMVAARAHVSKRTIYELFAGKVDLFGAVVSKHRRLILDLPRPPDEDLPMLETLIKVFRLDMDRQQDVEREALLNLIVRESTLVPDLSNVLYEQGIISFREDLVTWLELEAERGRITVEDPALCAGLFMDLVFGALLPRRRQVGDDARDGRKRDIVARLSIVLRGLGQ